MAMRLAWPALFLLAAAGCSADEDAGDVTAETDELAQLDSSYIEQIEGHEGHNLLAKGDRLERGMALANVVKKLEGKQYCSPERTFFRGTDGAISVWAIQCHDGSAYQVVAERDGSGGTLSCAVVDSLDGAGACWKALGSSALSTKKTSEKQGKI